MAKAKIWKIGTRIHTYIDTFFEWINSYGIDQGDHFDIAYNPKNNNVLFVFGGIDSIEIVDSTKGTQMSKILIMLNIIKPDGIDKVNKDSELIDQVTYSINSNENNWRENFIDLISNYSYIDQVNEDGNDELEFLFKQQKNAVYSLIKSFEAYNDEDIDDYDDEDKKALGYWIIKDLFKDFDNEMKSIADKVLHPVSGKVKMLKNLDSVKWKDFKIKNLDEVKDGNIESALWNLSDILSSSKDISIPIMQRKYVWDTVLVDKLIDDIFSIGEKKPFHYIGSIVYKENNKKTEIRILDGQQRLTTMFLILTALYSFFISEPANKCGIEVPTFFKTIFPKKNEKNTFALNKRFRHVHGNKEFNEFNKILTDAEAPKQIEQGNMSTNFLYAQEKINEHFNSFPEGVRQSVLESIFRNLVERVAFTVNKNQIESEYEIFEKLNTLSKPLNQIDLMKNHLLPYCKSSDLDDNESSIQSEFEQHIFSKFEKNKKVSEASVKRFVNYFIQLNSTKFLTGDQIKLKPFDKLSTIIENKYSLKIGGRNFNTFIQLLKEIGDEVDSFLSITDREHYTKSDNIYYDYSDILGSFEKRYVYAPLIKKIFDLHNVENLSTSNKKELATINDVRKILFEIERYELFMQVVLYRGQSITGIIEKATKEVELIFEKKRNGSATSHNDETKLTPEEMRDIFNDESIMSSNLVIPTNETFRKKISEETIADKVSILILNRMKFYFNNKNSIEINTSFENRYLKKPTREHIVSQKLVDDKVKKEIFLANSKKDINKKYDAGEFNKIHKMSIDMIGNIMMVEGSDNSKFKNKSPMSKLKDYVKLPYLENDPVFVGLEKNVKNNPLALKNNLEITQMGFDDIKERSAVIAEYISDIYK